MNHLTDCCILLVYCMCSPLFYPADSGFMIAFFLAVIVSSVLYLLSAVPYRLAVMFCYAAALFVLPKLCLFLPLIVYSSYLPGDGRGRESFFSLASLALMAAGLLAAAWQTHLWQITAYISCGVLFGALLHRRIVSYESLYSRHLQMRDSDTEVTLLLQEKNQSLRDKQDYEIYAATLKERNRIAREIHDNVGHMLTRSILMVGALKTVSHDAAMDEPLSRLDDTLNQAMNSIRESVHDLRDRSVNLEESLRALIRDFLFCPVTFQYDMTADAPSPVKYCFIAVVKEALVNISRHSSASAAWIRVREHPGFYQLSIRDNGAVKRADVSSGEPADGMGLADMRSRVGSLNGTMQILSRDGFHIFITIPKEQSYESCADR